MSVNVTTSFDKKSAMKRVTKATDNAQMALSKQALKDCNKYAKEDTGDLIDSSKSESKLKDGLLIWKTPYARYQYYLTNTRTVINPYATFMWAHYAESKHGKEWRKTVQDHINKGV